MPSGLQQLEVLCNRARLLHPETSHYMLFSKSGFDEHVAARAGSKVDKSLPGWNRGKYAKASRSRDA